MAVNGIRRLACSLAVCAFRASKPVVGPSPPAPPPATAPPSAPTPNVAVIARDTELFVLVTQTEPSASYHLFPDAEEVTSGTLNGSSAHRPLVRRSMTPQQSVPFNTEVAALGDAPERIGRLQGRSDERRHDRDRRSCAKALTATLPERAGCRLSSIPIGTVGYSITHGGSGCTTLSLARARSAR